MYRDRLLRTHWRGGGVQTPYAFPISIMSKSAYREGGQIRFLKCIRNKRTNPYSQHFDTKKFNKWTMRLFRKSSLVKLDIDEKKRGIHNLKRTFPRNKRRSKRKMYNCARLVTIRSAYFWRMLMGLKSFGFVPCYSLSQLPPKF